MRSTSSQLRFLTAPLLKRVVALACVVAYAFSSSGLGKFVAVALASLDTQHVVQISSAGANEVQIVLHHDGRGAARAANHEHQLQARLLTMLTSASLSENGDHVLCLSTPAKSLCQERNVALPRPAIAALQSAFPFQAEWALPAIAKAFPRSACHGVEIRGGSHIVTRTTVFLI